MVFMADDQASLEPDPVITSEKKQANNTLTNSIVIGRSDSKSFAKEKKLVSRPSPNKRAKPTVKDSNSRTFIVVQQKVDDLKSVKSFESENTQNLSQKGLNSVQSLELVPAVAESQGKQDVDIPIKKKRQIYL